jgi:hypothetical protein
MILPVAMYWCETLSLTLSVEYKLTVFEKYRVRWRGRKWRETGEDYILRNFLTSRFTIYYRGNQTKKDEIGGTCSKYGIDEKCILCFDRKT